MLIELGRSPIEGVGVFAVTALSAGQRIAAGIDEADFRRLIPWAHFAEYDGALRDKIEAFCIGTPEGFIPPADLDFNRLTVEWYLNHSCVGNVGFNARGDFVARREVEKGSELTYDYGLAESNSLFRMVCKCGERACRKIVTGNDWRDPAFRDKNLDYMLPRLRKRGGHTDAVPAKVNRVANRRR